MTQSQLPKLGNFGNVTFADFIVRAAYQMGKKPLLPLFAASLGAGDLLLGTILSVSTLTGMFLKPFIGISVGSVGATRVAAAGDYFLCYSSLLLPLCPYSRAAFRHSDNPRHGDGHLWSGNAGVCCRAVDAQSRDSTGHLRHCPGRRIRYGSSRGRIYAALYGCSHRLYSYWSAKLCGVRANIAAFRCT